MGSNPVPNGTYSAPGIIRYLANNANQQHQSNNIMNSGNGNGNAIITSSTTTNNNHHHQNNDGTSSSTSDFSSSIPVQQHNGLAVSAPLHQPYQQQQQQQQQQHPHQFQHYPVHQHANGLIPTGIQSTTAAPTPIMQQPQQPQQHAQQLQQQQQQQPHQPPGIAAHFDTPPIFRNMALRRGKWTQEEEAYSDYLIKEFEKGTINGLENGCTLRAFLSKKLHCAPMRISKKYAGKSIGKHVFLSRKPGNSMNKGTNGGTGENGDTSNENDKKLEELANKFYKSLFQDGEGGGSNHPMVQQFQLGQCFPQPGLNQTPQAVGALPQHVFNQPLHYPGVGPYIQPQQTFGLGGQMQIPFVPQTTNGLTMQQPETKSSTQAIPQQQQPQQQQPVAQPSAAKLQQHVAANISQLQKTYLKALKQMNVSPPARTDSGQVAAPAPQNQEHKTPAAAPTTAHNETNIQPTTHHHHHHPQQQQTNIDAKQAAAQKQSSGSTMNANSNKQIPLSAPQERPLHPPIPLQHPGHQPIAPLVETPKQNQNPSAHVHPAGQQASPAQPINPYASAGSFDIPDFLSGFERVAGQKHPASNMDFLQGVESQYSPTFTSKSFDDLHQFLGKGDFDQEPLDLGGKDDTAGTSGSMGDVASSSQHCAATTVGDAGKAMMIAEAKGMPHPPLLGNGSNTGNEHSAVPSVGTGPSNSFLSFVTADAYAMFAQQSALAVSQHSAYCRPESANNHSPTSQPSVPNDAQGPAMIIDDATSSSKVNAANLRAHAKAAEQTANVGTSTTKSKLQTYMRRHANIVSSSERSNSDMGTEESESALGSSRGSGSEGSESNDPSDNTSNDSDSASDDGPVHKKVKTENCASSGAQQREGMSPLSPSHLPSHRGQ